MNPNLNHGRHGNWNLVTSSGSPKGREVSQFCAVDADGVSVEILCTSLLFVSTAGREAGSCESAFASLEEESAEWPFGPRSGQESPTLGANRATPKKKIEAGRENWSLAEFKRLSPRPSSQSGEGEEKAQETFCRHVGTILKDN